ncbi:hypothetical protein BC940DRAFT_298761 [Gongronella butleri]|nr:hypothetical protein BC940DRAFT_298761 [Gongronella butleri]
MVHRVDWRDAVHRGVGGVDLAGHRELIFPIIGTDGFGGFSVAGIVRIIESNKVIQILVIDVTLAILVGVHHVFHADVAVATGGWMRHRCVFKVHMRYNAGGRACRFQWHRINVHVHAMMVCDGWLGRREVDGHVGNIWDHCAGYGVVNCSDGHLVVLAAPFGDAGYMSLKGLDLHEMLFLVFEECDCQLLVKLAHDGALDIGLLIKLTEENEKAVGNARIALFLGNLFHCVHNVVNHRLVIEHVKAMGLEQPRHKETWLVPRLRRHIRKRRRNMISTALAGRQHQVHTTTVMHKRGRHG